MFFVESRNTWININLVSELRRQENYGGSGICAFVIIMNNGNEYIATKEEITKLKNIIG